jgi:hypothetical protein
MVPRGEDDTLVTAERWGIPEPDEDVFPAAGCLVLREGRSVLFSEESPSARCAHHVRDPSRAAMCLPLKPTGCGSIERPVLMRPST